MSKTRIEELLVEWEYSRLSGDEKSVSDLCGQNPELSSELETKIQQLRNTAWMLEDPVPSQLPNHVEDSISRFMNRDDVADSTRVDATERKLGSQESSSETRPSYTQVQLDARKSEFDSAGFELLSELGRGGFGVVYRARDKQLNRQVAIKVPLIDNPSARERYLREARNAALVESQGLVPVLQVGETNLGTQFVVQRLIEGSNLAEVIRNEGRIPEDRAIEILCRICDAMIEAHRRGLVHRDLKPANIILDENSNPWITDFGLAFTEQDLHSDPHLKSHVGGTLSYMSPEQLQGNMERVDGRADIWALGVILYQCLTGDLPFRGTDEAETIDQIKQHDPRPITQVVPQLEAKYDEIFRKCCSKETESRYAGFAQLKGDLELLKTTSLPGKRSPVAPLTALIGVTALICGTLFLLNHGSQKPRTNEQSISSGNFPTIGDAIAFAAAQVKTEAAIEIEIPPGNVEESIVIRRSVVLRASGDRQETILQGADGPAFTVKEGGSLRLVGLTIVEAPNSSDEFNNAIDVQGGKLEIENCKIHSSGYDCIRLDSGSSLLCSDSDLVSTIHPAIYAKSAMDFELVNCEIEFAPNGDLDEDGAAVGIQLRRMGGRVQDCVFRGDLATGIEWGDSKDPIFIEDSAFEQMDVGLVAFNCSNVNLGNLTGCQFLGCNMAVQLAMSSGQLSKLKIDGQENANASGVLAIGHYPTTDKDGYPILLNSCSIRRTKEALKLKQSAVSIIDLQVPNCGGSAVTLGGGSRLILAGDTSIKNCRDFGLRLEKSLAVLTRVSIDGCGVAGIAVDGAEKALILDGCLVGGCDVGLWLASGEAILQDSELLKCEVGVLMSRKSEVGHVATGDRPLQLLATGGKCSATRRAIQFLSPGKCRFDKFALSDPEGGKINASETLVVSQDDAVIEVTSISR